MFSSFFSFLLEDELFFTFLWKSLSLTPFQNFIDIMTVYILIFNVICFINSSQEPLKVCKNIEDKVNTLGYFSFLFWGEFKVESFIQCIAYVTKKQTERIRIHKKAWINIRIFTQVKIITYLLIQINHTWSFIKCKQIKNVNFPWRYWKFLRKLPTKFKF